MLFWNLTSVRMVAAVLLMGASQAAHAEIIVGVTRVLKVPFAVTIDTEAPLLPIDALRLQGIPAKAEIIAVDRRPATGEYYAVATHQGSAQLYVIATTGVATAVGPPFTGLVTTPGTQFGFDFNPTIDRVRLVSTAGQNIVFNPNDGVVTTAVNLFYAVGDENEGEVPAVAHIAYDNNVAGATTTLQRGIDVDLDVLVTVANNAGTLSTIGPLGVDATSIGGFDVSGTTGKGFAILRSANSPVQVLYSIDLATGAATPLGVPALGLLSITSMTVVE